MVLCSGQHQLFFSSFVFLVHAISISQSLSLSARKQATFSSIHSHFYLRHRTRGENSLKLSSTTDDSAVRAEASAILSDRLTQACSSVDKLDCDPIFTTFAQSPEFRKHFWQRHPFLYKGTLGNTVEAFSMSDVQHAVDTDFLEAGRGSYEEGKGGWNMAAVSTPRGSSFQEAKLRFDDIQVAMKKKSGTVVFNSAGGFIPSLAGVCLQAVNCFDLPSALNLYLTAPGQLVSAPPHTDKQDVFVLQTQGQKRWRVFAPAPPSRMPRADPLARGKGLDSLSLSELTDPIIDVVMCPGMVLYVPAGFPHTTDTSNGVSTVDPSVHLTVGIDTHIWGLNYASLRSNALKRANLPDKILITKLRDDQYWALQSALPLGFQADKDSSGTSEDSMRNYGGMAPGIATKLIALMRESEPARWPQTEGVPELSIQLDLESTVDRALRHHRHMTDLFGKMYADVAFKISPAQMDLSFFRSKPYFEALDKSMQGYMNWHVENNLQETTTVQTSRGKAKGFGQASKSKK